MFISNLIIKDIQNRMNTYDKDSPVYLELKSLLEQISGWVSKVG